ncbi:MAG: hypothetical protein PHH13_05115 [Candidatus Peribacteraceae bacterium]|nr:hypothetical protein [Candidatus Peribacteraceae bacterium]
MRSLPLKTIGILSALAFSIFVIAIFLIATHLFTLATLTPAHLLPADRLEALFSNMPAPMLKRFTDAFPLLSSITDDHAAIAIIRLDDETPSTVIFDRVTSQPEDTATIMGPFKVTVSDARATKFLGLKDARLAHHTPYQLLSTERKPADQWAFFAAGSLPPPSSLPQHLFSALLQTDSRATVLTLTPTGCEVRVAGTAWPAMVSASPLFVGSMSGTLAIVRIADPATLWKVLMEHLDRPNLSLVRGSLEYAVAQFFGPEVSIRENFLPLLTNATTVVLTQTSSSTNIAVTGALPALQELTQRLSTLRDAFSSAVAPIITTTQPLKRDLTFTSLRIDPSTISTQRTSQGWWQVEHTIRGDAHEFTTAQSAVSFALSTNSTLLTDLLERDENRSLPTTAGHGRLLMGGVLNLNNLRKLFAQSAPALLEESPVLLLPLPSTQSIVWSIEATNSVTTLTVNNEQ